ncbi:Ig-like domain-containing protein [Roseinatronobacter sp. S2]|uniref:Ig-like domain-containing protein n=1 Tax=Roseinatronobacter sp. S2 TaxID=3035471 RepID=UPI0024101506|nr:Ig-like domain-containing protein [Roseinatronobacter sp. S2]WFE77143.1 Ig-like domain-containing protein [Roseinatronobacter sp. S2]
MVGNRTAMLWLKRCALIWALVLPALAISQAAAQTVDPNAPYEDAYDALTRGQLVGTWQGAISGSSISQADGQMAGQAVFVRRGYEGRNDFGIVLHDHRHRDGVDYSEISIGNIPCGPDGGVVRAVHGLEMQNAPAGAFASVLFDNRLADTGRDDFLVSPVYGPELDNPANLQTRWSDDGFTLRLSGPFISIVAPVRNGTVDYERQGEGWIEQLHLDVEFILERSPETEAAFDRMMCKEPDVFHVVETEPLNGRENVILEGADFFVEFSDAVAEGSLDSDTVIMTTRDRNNGLIFVDLELGLEDENGIDDDKSLRLAPREPLRSGTVYEITVVGGNAGVRGIERQVLERDTTFFVSTIIDPDDLRFGIYQVSRNAPLVHGKPAAARIQVEWEELLDIHPDWQVFAYPVLAEVLDDRDNTVFPQIQQRVERPDQYTDEDRRLGEHTVDLFGWTPSPQNDPRNFRAEITPADHYPEDVEITPAIVEQTLDYAAQPIDLLTFDYYIAAHSEWRDNIDIEQSRQVVQAAQQDGAFANQIFPVARVRGRFQGTYNLQDTICTILGVEWVVCEDGFRFWDNPASQAADFNEWNALVRLFHEHVAAHSNADILVSYHPPSLGGTGITQAPFEQPESLRRSGDEPYWFGNPDPDLLDSLHADRTGQNTIMMSTWIPTNQMFPGILLSPLVAHEFGHVFGLPHTPYAENNAHRQKICRTGYQTVAPGIDGMRIALHGLTGWQKSSEHGNAQTRAPLLNLMFPCIYEPHSDYWIDPNQYNWLVENMPAMLRYTRNQRAEAPVFSRVQFAQLSDPAAGNIVRSDANPELPDVRWIMLSGLVDRAEATLMPAIGVQGSREPLSGNGPYELRVEGAAGQLLARASVGPRPFETGPWPFAVTVPISGDPTRIVLLRDTEVLAERRADPALAVPEVFSHAPGSTYRAGETLEWGSASAEGRTYTLRFTTDGEAWTTLAVLLGEPRFTPDPATLGPGLNPSFEIIVHDGVTERATRLPVEVNVPLEPLAVWPEDRESGGSAGIAFNVPIDAETLAAITLEANGASVPAHVTLDPSGMIVTVAPQEPEADAVFTAMADTSLAAVDGRSIRNAIRVSFTAEPLEPVVAAAAREIATPGSSPSSDDAAAADAEIAGIGEIRLELGQPLTVPAQILRCATDEDNRLSQLEITFETTPGDWVGITMSRDADDVLTVQMALSNGAQFNNQGGVNNGWHFRLEDEQVSVQARVGGPGEQVRFSMTGECSSR